MEYPVKIRFTSKDDTGGMSGGTRNNTAGGRENVKEQKKQTGQLAKIGGLVAVVASVANIIAPIVKLIGDLLSYAVFGLMILWLTQLKKLIEIVKFVFSDSGFSKIVDYVKGIAAMVWEKAKEKFLGAVNVVVEWFKGLPSLIWDKIKGAWDYLKGVLKSIWTSYLQPVWDTIRGYLNTLWETYLEPAWNKLLTVLNSVWDNYIKPAWESLKGYLETIWSNFLKPAWESLVSFLGTIWNNLLKPAWDAVVKGIKSVANMVVNAFSYVVSRIKSFAKDLASRLFKRDKDNDTDGSRAFGGIISKDGLYRMHAGEQVSRGNTSTVNNRSQNISVTVNGTVTRDNVDLLARQIQQRLQGYSRW